MFDQPTTGDKVKHWIKYIVFNGLFAACAVYGFHYDIEWCQNLFKYLTIASTVLMGIASAVMMLITAKTPYILQNLDFQGERDKINKLFRIVNTPVWIDVTYDILMILFLVVTGNLALGIAWTMIMFMSRYIVYAGSVYKEALVRHVEMRRPEEALVRDMLSTAEMDSESEDSLRRLGIIN